MKKRVICLALAMSFVFASVISTQAARGQWSVNNDYVTEVAPTEITLKDITRIIDKVIPDMGSKLGGAHQKSPVTIVNAKQLDRTRWVCRFAFGPVGQAGTIYEDYYITARSYKADNTNPVEPKYYMGVSDKPGIYELLPNYEEAVKELGKAGFYFGLFDASNGHRICGFGIAERIKRWPSWNDLTFNGPSGTVYVTGSYDQESSGEFLAKALGK